MLTEAEKTQAISDVACLIEASGLEATIFRPASGEGLFGVEEGTFSEMETVPIELNPTPPEQLADTVDATASVLPGANVRQKDHLVLGSARYRVQTIKEERLFGAVTHQALELARVHGR